VAVDVGTRTIIPADRMGHLDAENFGKSSHATGLFFVAGISQAIQSKLFKDKFILF
jgi:hypothetical protein